MGRRVRVVLSGTCKVGESVPKRIYLMWAATCIATSLIVNQFTISFFLIPEMRRRQQLEDDVRHAEKWVDKLWSEVQQWREKDRLATFANLSDETQ